MGGLHIIGTERHESRRIDNQLRGRAGRQGDPGSSRFFLSLEDDLMRKFAGEWVSAVLTRLGMQEGEAIESKMVSRRIEGAQKKVEERNFDIRKNLLEYDEVMDEQRKRVYSFRQSLLDGDAAQGHDPRDDRQPDPGRRRPVPRRRLRRGQLRRVGRPAAGRRARPPATSRARASRTPRRSPGPRPSASSARRSARPSRRTSPPTPSPRNGPGRRWPTGPTTASSSTSRTKTSRSIASTDGDEFQFGRDDLEEFLNEKAAESLAEGRPRRRPASSSCPTGAAGRSRGWVHHKFALAIDPASWAELDRAEIVRRIQAAGPRALRPEGSRAAGPDRA